MRGINGKFKRKHRTKIATKVLTSSRNFINCHVKADRERERAGERERERDKKEIYTAEERSVRQ